MKTIGKLTAFSLSLFLLGGCFLLTFILSSDILCLKIYRQTI